MIELFRSLAVLVEPPREETARLARLLELPAVPEAWEYTELFEQQLYPYASVYLGPEGKLGGTSCDLIAGFWRALGETPPVEPDHLSVLLGLYAHLLDLERQTDDAARAAAWRRARIALLWEHLLSWLPLWLDKLGRIAPPAYVAWARVLADALAAECERVDLPPQLPVHLQDAPALCLPTETGGEAFLEDLLAPVRTGLILTRTDLAAAARQLGLGLRAGERRYALRALIGQDGPRVLDWLAGAATTAADAAIPGPEVVREFWRARAWHAASILRHASEQIDRD